MRALVLVALAACAHGVSDPLPPDDASPPASPSAPEASEQIPEPVPCSLRDRIVTDGGYVFDVPLPCVPLPSRDFGDPTP